MAGTVYSVTVPVHLPPTPSTSSTEPPVSILPPEKSPTPTPSTSQPIPVRPQPVAADEERQSYATVFWNGKKYRLTVTELTANGSTKRIGYTKSDWNQIKAEICKLWDEMKTNDSSFVNGSGSLNVDKSQWTSSDKNVDLSGSETFKTFRQVFNQAEPRIVMSEVPKKKKPSPVSQQPAQKPDDADDVDHSLPQPPQAPEEPWWRRAAGWFKKKIPFLN